MYPQSVKDYLFIVIEGLDGSGKSTISQALTERFTALGYPVLTTNEPNVNYCAGSYIDKILKKEIHGISNNTLALAFSANRADHIEREIYPFINRNIFPVIICDRYILSAMAYQVSKNVTFDYIYQINKFALKPTITFFLDTTPSVCEKRVNKRECKTELFEEKFEEKRKNFLNAIEYLRSAGESLEIIDASMSVEKIVIEIESNIKVFYPKLNHKNKP